jgi:hypothetical protein
MPRVRGRKIEKPLPEAAEPPSSPSLPGPSDLLLRAPTLFAGVFLSLVAASPWQIGGMGYAPENAKAADQILGRLLGDGNAIDWPRHGIVEPIVELPFAAVARALPGGSPLWLDRLVAIVPMLATALLATVVFLWARRLGASPFSSWLLAVGGTFGTMLWPYAYIGLETTGALGLLLAGYLALDATAPPTLRRTILFALAVGLAFSTKINGAFLLPPLLHCSFRFFFSGDSRSPSPVRNASRLGLFLAIVVLLGGVAIFTRSLFPPHEHRAASRFLEWLPDDPFLWISNLSSLFLSPNKGLLFYAPVVPLLLFCRSAPKGPGGGERRFAWLAVAGTAVGTSMFFFWSDETWGPRYLHAALPPILVAGAAALAGRPFRLRRDWPTVAALTLGAGISFLGVLFFFGNLHSVAIRLGEATMETLQSDPAWNPIRFHFRLLTVWRRGTVGPPLADDLWAPKRHSWGSESSPPILRREPVDLRPFSVPLPLLFRKVEQVPVGLPRALRIVSGVAFVLGALLLAGSALRALRKDRLDERTQRENPTDG